MDHDSLCSLCRARAAEMQMQRCISGMRFHPFWVNNSLEMQQRRPRGQRTKLNKYKCVFYANAEHLNVVKWVKPGLTGWLSVWPGENASVDRRKSYLLWIYGRLDKIDLRPRSWRGRRTSSWPKGPRSTLCKRAKPAKKGLKRCTSNTN